MTHPEDGGSSISDPLFEYVSYGWLGFVVLTLLLLIWRRKRQPVLQRNAVVLLLTGLGSGAAATVLLLRFDDDFFGSDEFFCKLWGRTHLFAWSAVVVPTLLRAWHLSRVFTLESEVHPDTAESHSLNTPLVADVHEEHGVITQRRVALYALSIVLLVTLINTTVAFFVAEHALITCITDRDGITLSLATWMVLHVIEIGLLLYWKRRTSSAVGTRAFFGMSTELTLLTVVWSLVLLLLGMILWVNIDSETWRFLYRAFRRDPDEVPPHATPQFVWDAVAFTQIVRFASIFFISCFTTVFSSFSSYYDIERDDTDGIDDEDDEGHIGLIWSTTRSLESLTALLRDIVCVNAFAKWLHAYEPSSFEHLLCWLEIELFRDMAPSQARTETAIEIYQRFVPRLDLSHSTALRLHAALGSGTVDAHSGVFDALQQEVFASLDAFCFERFLLSREGVALRERLLREERLRARLATAGMIDIKQHPCPSARDEELLQAHEDMARVDVQTVQSRRTFDEVGVRTVDHVDVAYDDA